MLPMFIPFFYPFYIKKEHAKDLIKIQRRFVSITLIGSAIVLAIIQFAVSPKLFSMYQEFNVPIPFVTQMSPIVSFCAIILLVIISTVLLLKESDYSELNEKLKKYKEGEMIRSKEIINTKKELVWLIPMFIVVGWIVLSVIQPIYNLTNTLK